MHAFCRKISNGTKNAALVMTSNGSYPKGCESAYTCTLRRPGVLEVVHRQLGQAATDVCILLQANPENLVIKLQTFLLSAAPPSWASKCR